MPTCKDNSRISIESFMLAKEVYQTFFLGRGTEYDAESYFEPNAPTFDDAHFDRI